MAFTTDSYTQKVNRMLPRCWVAVDKNKVYKLHIGYFSEYVTEVMYSKWSVDHQQVNRMMVQLAKQIAENNP